MKLNQIFESDGTPMRWSGHVSREDIDSLCWDLSQRPSLEPEEFHQLFLSNFEDNYSEEEIDNQQLDCDINIAYYRYTTEEWPREPYKWWDEVH